MAAIGFLIWKLPWPVFRDTPSADMTHLGLGRKAVPARAAIGRLSPALKNLSRAPTFATVVATESRSLHR